MSNSFVALSIPSHVVARVMEAYARRNETLARNYIAGDWNQFNKANAEISEELWPIFFALAQAPASASARS